ncbi:WecB/TagA/CpsF family glycosyltransferase [Levilactobacillus brevis]|uniref:WecB/TagA/CpsF family glycosyltransferase n=1 Tax=Levilactobacillus brevis TaxID=1580 RepID=UPI0009CC9FFB|nr:WecB/TagA/CpsF family glycosyltransferase [Levilactobacillus brevis]MBL3536292.1 WecB/TagA/CpsF family glycosyltransferase [Lactobacillus sp. GPR40-2]MBL3629567.1 WecB/TagA/CpsF family glycosyltransferase [Lactobacillus sp. GPB7-4]OOV23352.1 glycosyltransferase [Levilactobacillus brevis]RDG05262.1 glycosyltransferase [Levilactobacillus brevis]WCJ47214.1 WecB/TagA/CpsF family glycosyltransferase [Levilactobacillus brevis]
MRLGKLNKKKIDVLGVSFDALTMDETVELVQRYISRHVGAHLLGVNADKILAIEKDKRLDKIVHSADIINADGASVILASKVLNAPLPERVAGIDLMQRLLDTAAKNGNSVYFIGARNEVVSEMVKRLMQKYQNLIISGYRDGYFDESCWKDIATKLKKSRTDIVFIGITSPLKEYFIDYLLSEGVSSILMGVGGSFDVLAGKVRRAPVWMQKINLEWLYRVYQEPRRLFMRYFIGNSRFIIKVIRSRFLKNDGNGEDV